MRGERGLEDGDGAKAVDKVKKIVSTRESDDKILAPDCKIEVLVDLDGSGEASGGADEEGIVISIAKGVAVGSDVFCALSLAQFGWGWLIVRNVEREGLVGGN